MLKISDVYLIGNPEIPIHYTSLSQVEQALLLHIIDFDSIAWNSEAEGCWHNAAPRSEHIRSQNYALFSRLKKRAGLGVIWFDAFPGNNNSALG